MPKHLKAKVLISYSLKGFSARDKSRIHRTLYGYQMKTKIENKVYEVAKEGLVSGANKKLGPGTVILTLNAWSKLEGIFEQLKVKYVKYKIWQDE
jgi:extradiol dioxygenase family protein